MTTTRRRETLHCTARLLIIGSLAFVHAGVAEDAVSVRTDGESVSITAQQVELSSVVDEIVDEFGLRYVLHAPLDRKVIANIEEQSLPDALSALLTEESFQLFLPSLTDVPARQAIPGTLWIFADGSGVATAAVVFLEAALLNGMIREKQEAIRELRRLGTPEAAQALSLALGDDNGRVRKAAIAALRRIGSDEAMAAIASTLSSTDSVLRSQAVAALASGNADTSAQYLALALDDRDPRVRVAALEALADMPFGQVPTQAAVAAFTRALQDEDVQVRMQAVDSLEEIGGAVAYETLMLAKRNSNAEVARAATESLPSDALQ